MFVLTTPENENKECRARKSIDGLSDKKDVKRRGTQCVELDSRTPTPNIEMVHEACTEKSTAFRRWQ